MRTYFALLDGGDRDEPVQVRRAAPGLYEVKLRGKVHVVDACRHDARTLSLVLDQASYAATLDWRDARVNVRFRQAALSLELLDERRLRLRKRAAMRRAGREAVVAGLPGRVLEVRVKPGEAVRAGQVLVVVGALDMENELRAPKDGRVVELHAREGQTVARNERLCAVE